MLCLYVNQYKIDEIELPNFTGSSDEKLRKACCWVSKYCPGRTLTLEQIGLIMGSSSDATPSPVHRGSGHLSDVSLSPSSQLPSPVHDGAANM